MDQLGKLPLKVKGHSWVTVNDVGKAEDSHQIQTNIVRIDGQKSVYIPVMKQGGDTNTIAVVDGLRELHLQKLICTTFPSRWLLALCLTSLCM